MLASDLSMRQTPAMKDRRKPVIVASPNSRLWTLPQHPKHPYFTPKPSIVLLETRKRAYRPSLRGDSEVAP
jgi:hypothetical protein